MADTAVRITLNANGRGIPFAVFDTRASRVTLNLIISGKAYPLVPFIKSPSVIVDVGANVGGAAAYFALRYPQASVHALEPAAAPFRLLSENARQFANIRPSNVGLYSEDRHAPLYHGKIDSITASVGKSVLNVPESEVIVLRSADAWLHEQGIERIDILKVDTEGCEIAILESIRHRLASIDVIYIEFHSEEDRLRLDALLSHSHVIYRGHIAHVHRGELCYVAKAAFPSLEALDRDKISVRF